MKKLIVSVLIALCLFTYALSFSPKVDDLLLNELSLYAGKTSFLIHMKERVDLDKITNNQGKLLGQIEDYDERAELIVAYLMKTAEITQKPVIEYLKKRGLRYDVLWITNSIFVHDGELKDVQYLAQRDDVESLFSNNRVVGDLGEPLDIPIKNISIADVEAHVTHIKSDLLWKEGFYGEGIVSAVADTGVRYTHEALIENYRGNNNGKFDHNYNWFDGTTSNSQAPSDSNGHGTHCQSIAVGGNKGRSVGSAPKAKWIACRALGGGSAGIVKCLQFFLAPTDLKGNNPKPELRPHVTSHSYYCTGCRAEDGINALYKAGVAFIKSAGNQGPGCRTITEPGFYEKAIAIGALQPSPSNVIASFSSRGPTTDGRLKPNFAAPGSSVVAAYIGSDTTYRALSGTSMAAPGMNGAMTLLWSAVPQLRRNIDKTIEVFEKTALKQTTNECNSNGSPNNVYGYGTINVYEAYKLAIKEFGKH